MVYLDYRQRIKELKEEKGAVILAHYYQLPEVQDIADYVGDSFALSRLAAQLPNPVLVFCGVRFMAETAKLLSREKKVFLPVSDAGCPMADMVTEKDVLAIKRQHPDAAVVTYVNSSTEVKALSDICCTSSNAVKIVKSVPNQKIIFLPDENLGSFVAGLVPEKEFILFNGFCPVHEEVMAIDVILAKAEHPGALFAAHPECRPEVRSLADFVGSTSQMIDFVLLSEHRSFIIGTEEGIHHPILKANPGKSVVSLTKNFVCANMKKTRLVHVYESLLNEYEEILIDESLAAKASLPLVRMLEASA